jgi:hypothetical protein
MSDQPTPDQSFSIHLKSLTDFADEFTTQIESLQAPMDHLATMSGTPPQYGAFAEAWALGAGEQAAIEEMYSLLGQVKQAIAFAGSVTGTVAEGYRRADEDISAALGGPPPPGSGGYEHTGPVGQRHWWQHTDATTGQVVGHDPAGPPPWSPPWSSSGAPGTDSPGLFSTVAHLVTGPQSTGPQSVWTPPPAATPPAAPPPAAPPPAAPLPAAPPAAATPPPGPAPSWTDYFQGIPQGGA